jgi:hypothetical protein
LDVLDPYGKKSTDQSNQKGNRIMPENETETKLLVRGPDGHLYLLSKDKPPQKLSPDDDQEVTKIVEDHEDNLAKDIENKIPALGHGVHIGTGVHCGIPEVFPG